MEDLYLYDCKYFFRFKIDVIVSDLSRKVTPEVLWDFIFWEKKELLLNIRAYLFWILFLYSFSHNKTIQ